MMRFLKTRKLWQIQISIIWVLITAILATLAWKQGHEAEAVMQVIVQGIIFIFAMYYQYSQSK